MPRLLDVSVRSNDRSEADTLRMRRLIDAGLRFLFFPIVFWLTGGVAYSLVSWVPVGIAPSWFRVGGPLFLASLVTGAIFWAGRADTAKDGPCLRIARRLNRFARQELDDDPGTEWWVLVMGGIFGMAVLQLPFVVQERAFGPVVLCAILVNRVLTWWTRLPGEGAQVERRVQIVKRLLGVVELSFIIWVIFTLW